MSTPPNPAFGRLASQSQRQHGLFTDLQLRDAGLSQAILNHRLRTGEIIAVDHHVYRATTTPVTWHQRVMAACLGGPAVASHRGAGALWVVAGRPTSYGTSRICSRTTRSPRSTASR